MLEVRTSEQVVEIIKERFGAGKKAAAKPPFACALAGCSFALPVIAKELLCAEDIPGFDRSTVDGFAVRASDTFGCSEAIPAILKLQGEIFMGEEAAEPLKPGYCFKIATGGMLPPGADAVVMLEYTEEYKSVSQSIEIGILKAAAAGSNIIFKGDDRKAGEPIIKAGRRLTAADIGALAAAGACTLRVQGREEPVLLKELLSSGLQASPSAPVAGIISTGDELIPIEEKPSAGQVRNANSLMLMALAAECGAASIDYGIIKDDEAALSAVLDRALSECDIVLISGGSSAGEKDKTAELLASRGELLLHGIAIKPGKPTILADAGGKAVFGLPGHPAAALLVSELFVKPLLKSLAGRPCEENTVTARLTENISSNHGREQIIAIRFSPELQGSPASQAPWAEPIISKSGLITALAGADGYFIIPRDCEGLPKGSQVAVRRFGE